MKIVGLFAGIGGLEFGLHQAGHETVAFSEIWAPAAEVLARRFDGVPNVGDVANFKSLPTGIDIVTAGFPCQDLSQAGRTAGINGGKSGLVDHVFRLLDRDRPQWVLLENVSFMLRLDRGSAMERLVEEFEQRKYRWAYRVVNSLSFLPHRRERVFSWRAPLMTPLTFCSSMRPTRYSLTQGWRLTRTDFTGQKVRAVWVGVPTASRRSKMGRPLEFLRHQQSCLRTVKSSLRIFAMPNGYRDCPRIGQSQLNQ